MLKMDNEILKIIDTAFDIRTPFIVYTNDYIYGLVPLDADGKRWKEISYMFEGEKNNLETREMAAELSFQFLCEEIEKGLSHYVEDLNVNKIKEYIESIKDKSGEEKIKIIIEELIAKSTDYSASMPIIKSKEELQVLKDKI